MLSSPPPRIAMPVSVSPSGPSWLTLLLTLLGTFLAGTATALLIQLYVVPRVETRKRREDRWERDVRELGELLTTRLTDSASDLHAAQLVFRDARDEESGKYGPELVARQAREAEEAMFAYSSLIRTQVAWLTGRVISPSLKASEIDRLRRAALEYQVRAIYVRVPEHDDRAGDAFREAWQNEFTARKALIDQVVLLADLPHPPRSRRSRRSRKARLGS